MMIEIDISRHLQPGDKGTLKALLDEGWRLGLELGPILVLRHHTKIAGELATALIELNGRTMHAFGWETTPLWGERDDIVGEQRKSLAKRSWTFATCCDWRMPAISRNSSHAASTELAWHS